MKLIYVLDENYKNKLLKDFQLIEQTKVDGHICWVMKSKKENFDCAQLDQKKFFCSNKLQFGR